MKRMARNARSHAYAPYSNFSVGACLKTERGTYTGANIELSGRNSIHAEQFAVFKAIFNGSENFEVMAISCTRQEGTEPCGYCLQTCAEFCRDVDFLLDCGDHWKETSLSEELPNAYRSDNK